MSTAKASKNDIQNISEETKSAENTQQPTEYRPRVQNRKAVIMFFKTVMADGKPRIEQVFDAPVAFSVHHEMINTINAFRADIFGEDGKLYETKNIALPMGSDTVVYALLVNTKTGKEINRKVFTGDEATAYMEKARAELEANRAKARQYHEEATSGDFGRPIQDAMNEALSKKTAASN